MLPVTMQSNFDGSRTSSAAIASTIFSSSSTSGYSCATLRTSRRKSPSEMWNTFALCTAVTFLRRLRAQSNATREMRLHWRAVTLRIGDRDVFGRHELAAAHEHVAVGVEAFGAFAEDHEIDGLAGEAHAHARFRRADVREEIELHAELARRVDAALLARRVLEMVDGPEDDARRVARGLHHVVGQRRAALLQRAEPHLHLSAIRARA